MCYVTMGEHFFMSTSIYLVITGTKLIDFPAYNFNMFVSVSINIQHQPNKKVFLQ